MRYVIPSLGRCGSSVMARAIERASGASGWPYRQDWARATDAVIKTHGHFHGEPAFEYRAVYCWGPLGDVFASLRSYMGAHLIPHLEHLGVAADQIADFNQLSASDDLGAWLYLITGDKCRFVDNLTTWEGSQQALFVHYTDWERNAEEVFRRVSAHTQLAVKPVTLHARRGHMGDLHPTLQAAIRAEYGGLA